MFKLLWVDHYDYGQFMAAAKVTWQRFVAVGIDLSGEKEDYWINDFVSRGELKLPDNIKLLYYDKDGVYYKNQNKVYLDKNQRAIVTKFLRRFRSVNGWK